MSMGMRERLIILAFAFAAVPLAALANGGDQRIIEGFSLTLSRAPFTPAVGEETSMLISFYDIAADMLVNETINASVRLRHLDAGVVEFEKAETTGSGVIQVKHEFARQGLYEIFVDFSLRSNPEMVYNAPDFLLDVQPKTVNPAIFAALGAVFGFLVGWLLGSRKQKD